MTDGVSGIGRAALVVVILGGAPWDAMAKRTVRRVPVRIVAIRFVGNKVTRAAILRQQMWIHVGDLVNVGLIARSRQAILNLGLFRSVYTTLKAVPGGDILSVVVRERYYILPIPRVSRNANGDVSYGGQLRWDNVAGLNQQLNMVYETTRTFNGSTIRSGSVNYNYPRIVGTPYSFSAAFSWSRSPDDYIINGSGQAYYRYNSTSAAFTISRFLRPDQPSTGWQAGIGMSAEQTHYGLLVGSPPYYANVRRVDITGFVGYSRVHDHIYSRSGRAFGYNVALGSRALGSQHNELQNSFFYEAYIPTGPPRHELDIRFELGLSNGYHNNVYFLGGADTLRGYAYNSLAGKAMVLANVQYLAPLFGSKPWRWAVFTDVGNAYASNSAIDLGDLGADVGFGLRYTLNAFVRVTLRLDYGYALTTAHHKAYGAGSDIF
ncbi:MAG: BamA/TamA family outer membrane protein [Acidiferrobacter sp.]